jgi:peptidase M28-like protein
VALAVAALGMLAAGAYAVAALKLDDQPPKPPNHPVVGPKRLDAETTAMINQIDAARIKASDLALVGFGTRNTLSSQDDPVRGIGAARNWLFDQFQQIAATSGGRMTVELQSYVQGVATGIPVPTVITNVVATLHGTDPASANRYYYVSGHYDSRCGSTNDDASGVTAVLEMARVMATHEFDANIVFMAVAGEEQNLYGSARAATLAQAAGQDVQGMFTNDIIGSSTGGNGIHNPYTVRLFAEGVPTNETTSEANTRRAIGGENDSPARQLARFIHSVAEIPETGMHVQIVYRRDRFNRGGDHISFLERGFRSAVRFTEPNENFNHQHQDVRIDPDTGEQIGDLPQFVDFDYIARVAKVNAVALAALANAPGAPKNVRITSNLSYDAALRWNANTEPDLAGYEVVWRETDETDWTHVIPVGLPEPDASGVVRYTAPLSKDDFFFGVRAVDAEGNRSTVVFPRP